ncbi:hypothetical protein [Methylobacterium aquaticum]|uniref:Uncharacterized protein n=1 Tax=Methylobacterium aquaticum TaxID=270351 RepID=A0A0J6S6Z5_9HYPH|nr:hypothetical protein [Methylobacterium aquaticum]KMO29474.1 hypothetical protein VP06_24675 [Methylobacterium aquaticum]
MLALAMFGVVSRLTAAFLREEPAETLRLEIRAAAEAPAGAVGRVGVPARPHPAPLLTGMNPIAPKTTAPIRGYCGRLS